MLTEIEKQAKADAKLYTLQLPAHGAAASIAARVRTPEVDAQSIAGGDSIELASSMPIDPAEVDEIQEMIETTVTPVMMPLPVFCLTGALDGPPPRRSPALTCGSQTPVQAANGKDIVTALAKDARFTVAAPSLTPNRLSIKCANACSQDDLHRVIEEISQLAWPSPAYVQDVETPAGTAADTAKQVTALKLMGITADPIGAAKVRLKSDSPVSQADVNAIMETFQYGSPAPPSFRMFYQDPNVVVPKLAPPPTPAGTGGNNTNSSNSAANGQASSNPPSNTQTNSPGANATSSDPSSAEATSTTVKFTTTSDTSTTTVKGTSPPSTPAGGGSNAKGAAKAAPSPADGAAGADNAAGADSPGAPPPANGDQTPAPPATETKSTTSVTVTPPPPAAPKAPATPAPAPLVGANMAAVNDNVVFTDTSNQALTWQRVRLLTLLDLPRPEVLMNMWSYQASSPDGNETLRNSEKLRDLVTAYNDSLENSIGYGWAYLSRQMKSDPLHLALASTGPNDSLENYIEYGWAYLSRQAIGPSQPMNAIGSQPEATQPGSARSGTASLFEVDPGGKVGPGPKDKPTPSQLRPRAFFDLDFYDYITQKFVADRQPCGDPGCVSGPFLPDYLRTAWGFCPPGKYCLGFTEAFQPVRANLTSILMGAIASQYPLKTILTTIGCMEGKYEVYGAECFPDRPAISEQIREERASAKRNGGSDDDDDATPKTKSSKGKKDSLTPEEQADRKQAEEKLKATEQADANREYQIHELEQLAIQIRQVRNDVDCPGCVEKLDGKLKEIGDRIAELRGGAPCPDCENFLASLNPVDKETLQPLDPIKAFNNYRNDIAREKSCIMRERRKLVNENHLKDQLSCELLDTIALQAQATCGVVQTFPLSCFTIQAAQSFSAPADFSTFTLKDLNELAETKLADMPIPEGSLPGTPYGATRIGLLRAAIADFLFNYKMSQEFPKDFVPYDLQHSAQELNAELNPLVVAYNEDVAAFSRNLQTRMEGASPTQTSVLQLWRNRKSFVSDGIITVRGIGGDPSTVDTVTQNFFDATKPQSLTDVANALTGQGGSAAAGSSPLAALASAGLNASTVVPALAAILPKPTVAQIGRELYLQVIPHTLPGASSAELDVTLKANDSADPTLFQSGTSVGADTTSRVSQFTVSTRVRVESVKMFELSSFSAMLQRPRGKFPLLPPLIELPWIGSIASLPLPGAKEYHRSTAIVSAVIVPTAADLAYGIDFSHDRLITGETTDRFGRNYLMRSIGSLSELTRTPIRAFHKAMTSCFATNGVLPFPSGPQFNPSKAGLTCHNLTFTSVPPEF